MAKKYMSILLVIVTIGCTNPIEKQKEGTMPDSQSNRSSKMVNDEPSDIIDDEDRGAYSAAINWLVPEKTDCSIIVIQKETVEWGELYCPP